jgi:UDP-N-acetylmuramoyl-tripeptide--D-alanyl-D-alanine ligase
MKYGLTDLPRLARTPLGRADLRLGLLCQAWPLVSRVAAVYRARIVPETRLVAVTGSFGKTTTIRAITAALGLQEPGRIRRNFSSFVAFAALQIRPGQRQAVVEVGAHSPGDIARYARLLRPDVAVVTSIGSEHQRSLLTLEGTRQEKSALVAALPPHGLAVLNGDDPHVLWMRSRTRARVATFGLGEANDLRASQVQLDWPRGTRFTLHLDGQQHPVRTRLVGRHQVASALAALAVAREAGLPLEQAIGRLEQLEARPGRLQLLETPNGAFILRDDFKAVYETIETALALLAEIPAERRWLVLGEIDEPPRPFGPAYRQIGEQAARAATRVLLVGGRNVRSYRSGLSAGGLAHDSVTLVGPSVLPAIDLLRKELQAGDVVLIKGRSRQRLERVAHGLLGRAVRCDLSGCPNSMPACDVCSYLEPGWTSLPPV